MNDMSGYYTNISKLIEPNLKPMASSGNQGGILVHDVDGGPDRVVTDVKEVVVV